MIIQCHPRLLAAGLGISLMVCAAGNAQEEVWLKDPITDCAIWTDEVDGFRETATWSGPCVEGKASGEGVLVWFKDNGLLGRYAGSMRTGKMHGRDILHYRPPDSLAAMRADLSDKTLDDGRLIYLYEGTMREGEMDGRGFLSYRSTRGFDRYEGEFRDGEIDGEVVYEGALGDRFEGRTQGLHGNGEGLFTAASGERYEGPFVNGVPSGKGTYTAPNGDVYEGNFVEGKAHGTVIVTRSDGRREELRWEHGRPVE